MSSSSSLSSNRISSFGFSTIVTFLGIDFACEVVSNEVVPTDPDGTEVITAREEATATEGATPFAEENTKPLLQTDVFTTTCKKSSR